MDFAFMGQLLEPPGAAGGGWEAVDSLLGGPSVAAGGISPSSKPGGAAAIPVPAPLRCLDSAHAPCCSSCTTAPASQFASWKLVGLETPKTLRSQILLTNEWNDREQRFASAVVCEGRAKEGGGVKEAASWHTLAVSLRARAASSLTKVHLLMLCHLWNYRSDLWTRKGASGSGTTRRRKAGDGAGEPSKAPRAAPPEDSVTALVPRSLRPTAVCQRAEMEAVIARMSERCVRVAPPAGYTLYSALTPCPSPG